MRYAGQEFDPFLVEIFLQNRRQIEKICEENNSKNEGICQGKEEEENESTSDKNWFSGNGASKEVCICVFNRSTVLLFD